MSTSGTIATTVIDTAMVVEHALRRCKVAPSAQTPEIISMATENLYLLLLSLSNRGLNLWAIESDLIGITANQATYAMPAGTIDVLNAVYSKPTRSTGTDSSTSTSYTTQFSSATKIARVGFKLTTVTASDTATISHSSDGITWTTAETETKTDWTTGLWYWIPLDPTITDSYFKVTFNSTVSFSELYLATSIYDLPLTQWNRDTWSVINNKAQSGSPSTCYYYEKLIVPQITLWPVPNNSYDHLTIFRHRQVQDIGTLSQQIEIPQRWVDGIIWQLAAAVSFELPQVDSAMIQAVVSMADKALNLSEMDETDGATIYMQPVIRGYTK